MPGGGKSTFRLYEDDGLSKNYEKEYAYTNIEKNLSGKTLTLIVHSREGAYGGMTASRKLYLQLEGWNALPAKILLNGQEAGESVLQGNAVMITLPGVSASETNRIEIIKH